MTDIITRSKNSDNTTYRTRWKDMGDGTHARVDYVGGGTLEATFSNGTSDAFGRLRVSEPETLFESQMQYNAAPLFWESTLTGGGTATHIPNEAAVRMRCTTASGDRVIRQSQRYVRYQPGKSQQILMTFVMGNEKAGVVQRVGYYDGNDGLFLQQASNGLAFVRRTSVTGAMVDNTVLRNNWNIDRMDGSGVSGIDLDMSKAQILIIDIEWLGVGRARLGFIVNGEIHYAHQFLNANNLTTVYMRTANLPLRYEIQNTAATASNTDMYQICASVSSEGGRHERNLTFGYTMVASRSVTNSVLPLLSIRVGTEMPSGSGSGLVNRELVYPIDISLYTEDAAIAYWVVRNATLTNPSWQNVNTTHSGVQYDISATALTGGIVIDGGGYLVSTPQSRQTTASDIESDLSMTLNSAGTVGDIMTIACVRLTNTSSDTWGAVTWKELY